MKKKILLCTLMAAVLASCASDKGPVDENKFKKKESQVKKTDDSKKFVPLIPSLPEECVTINGKFQRASTKQGEAAEEMTISTRRDGDKVSYSYNNDVVMADGEATEKDGVKTMAVCNKDSFEVTFVKEDKVSRVRFTQAADAKSVNLTVENSDEKIKALAGTYARVEEAAPAPTPGEDEDTL